jgi:hypothetical protein
MIASSCSESHRRRRTCCSGKEFRRDATVCHQITSSSILSALLFLLCFLHCSLGPCSAQNVTAFNSTTAMCDAVVANTTRTDEIGLMSSRLPWGGCEGLFDCLVEFCGCVNGTLSTTCTPYGINITNDMLQACTASRISCIVAAAQSAPWVSNASCRLWGGTLLTYYKSAYAAAAKSGSVTTTGDIFSNNYTRLCAADTCTVLSSGISATEDYYHSSSTVESNDSNGNTNNISNNSSVVGIASRNVSLSLDRVNISALCGIQPGRYPLIPLADNVVPGCALVGATAVETYFSNIPVSRCTGPAECIATYCSCVGQSWDRSRGGCSFGSDVIFPSSATAKTCFATAMSCVLNSALSLYVPGASPLDPDACLAWSVRIAEDYAVYYNTATNLSTTNLWQACNVSACQYLASVVGISGITPSLSDTACGFPGVSARPTFKPYNTCPYACPNGACAISIGYCICTAAATVSNLDATFAHPFGANTTSSISGSIVSVFDVTFSLTATAYATYRSNVTNCSSFDYTPLVGYLWNLFVFSNTSPPTQTLLLTSNRSSLVISSGSNVLQHGAEYLLALGAEGVLSNQTANRSWRFVALAPTPVVSITSLGSQLRVPSARSLLIRVIIVDMLPSANTSTFAWSCSVLFGSNACPSLTNATRLWLNIPSGSATGTFMVNYMYRGGVANSSVVISFVAGDLPYVRVLVSGTRVSSNAANMDTFFSSQFINIAAVVSYGGGNAVTYTWTRGVVGGPTTGNAITTASAASASVTVPATTLSKATLSSVVQGNPSVVNWVRVKVASTTDPTSYGEASVPIVVIEDLSMTLQATLQGTSNVTTVSALVSTISLRPYATVASAPLSSITTASSGPYGVAVDFAFAYYDLLDARWVALGLTVTPSSTWTESNLFLTTAPLYSNASASSQATIVSVAILFGGVVAARGNATLLIRRPSDITAAASSESAKIAAVTDPAAAVTIAANLRTLMAQSTSSTLVSFMSTAALTALSHIVSADAASVMSSGAKVSILATITTSLQFQITSDAQHAFFSRAIQALVVAAISPNADVIDSLSFANDNTDLVLDVLQAMDAQTGGQTAVYLTYAIVNAPTFPVGSVKSIARGGKMLLSVVKELASTLKSATTTSSGGGGSSITFSFDDTSSTTSSTVLNGASLVIPATSASTNTALLPWTSLDDDRVLGVTATVLSSDPYRTSSPVSSSSSSSSVVVVDLLLTSATGAPSALAVSGLQDSQAWVITIPNAAQGTLCAYYSKALGTWSREGVSTVLSNGTTSPTTAAVLQCKTTHLTAFGGLAPSSCAPVAFRASTLLLTITALLILQLLVVAV